MKKALMVKREHCKTAIYTVNRIGMSSCVLVAQVTKREVELS